MPTNERRQALLLWERELHNVMTSMELSNGQQGDDLEALVRVTWRMAHEEAKSDILHKSGPKR